VRQRKALRIICESAPEVTAHKPVGRVKVFEIFTLNSSNYHFDKLNDHAYTWTRVRTMLLW